MKNLKKYWPVIIIAGVIIFIGAIIFFQQKQTTGMILFFGEGCPHCQIVDDYIKANGVKGRFQFQELEVFNNRANAALMGKYARQCGLDTSQGLGVPFFWDGKNCLMGDQDIIKYFAATSSQPANNQ
jgi:hypothetical protein